LGNSFVDIDPGAGTDNRYQYDYQLVEAFGEYTTTLGETPVAFYGNYVVNTASSVKNDTGWLIGTTYNKASAPGTWQVGYEYVDVESDATLGRFTDSDFTGQWWLQPTRALSYGCYDITVGDKLASMVPHNQFGMVMTLILLVLTLNIAAITLRSRMSRKLRGS